MSSFILMALQISLITIMAGAKQTQNIQEGLSVINGGVEKLINILEGVSISNFTSEEYMLYYKTVYELCSPKSSLEVPRQVYNKYTEIFQDYITSKVLPSLKEKEEQDLVREVVKRWSNHKIMVRWLSRFFHYIDRYFIVKENLPSTEEAGFKTFHDLVYLEIKDELRRVLISMISQEREGENIDQELVKNALNIFVEMGRGCLKYYEQDFEQTMLKNTVAYYSNKASNCILVDSYADYMLKANVWFEQEKDRVANYLHSSSEKKLLEIVHQEVLFVYETKLQEMKQRNDDTQ